MYIPPTEVRVAAKICPFCNSADVKTTSKEVNAATYWRCASCGQVWNASRLSPGWRTPSGRFN
jgi:transposase-like protein